ncbi:MAG: ferrochelatase [Ignavibacteriae bacterium]|nr:ferrochelatase [Ignavibacteria bacterium]MBI3363944.1 ferrochelatase [Ignavibacteriota bacterium]
MNANERIGIVLFQLGGPDSLEAIEPFLYNLFRDPDIINFPGAFLARRPLAKFISSRRSKKVAEHYKEIGGKSPIVDLTNAQAAALQRELDEQMRAKVFVAMRYWHPMTQAVIQEMKKERFTKIVLLPLYPQFSKATTISSMKEWTRQCNINNFNHIPSLPICCYYNHPLYIDAIVDKINAAYKKFSHLSPADVDLVFSAHGVPVSLVKEGDPYKVQIEETVRLVVEKGQWKSPHFLCYQSKVGPAEWLKPSIDNTVHALAAQGRKHLLVIPVAFVTEHIETLHEINIETREEAKHLGIEQFEMMPALNDHPKFIQCLADLVLQKVTTGKNWLPMCRTLSQERAGVIPPALCPYWTRPEK